MFNVLKSYMLYLSFMMTFKIGTDYREVIMEVKTEYTDFFFVSSCIFLKDRTF